MQFFKSWILAGIESQKNDSNTCKGIMNFYSAFAISEIFKSEKNNTPQPLDKFEKLNDLFNNITSQGTLDDWKKLNKIMIKDTQVVFDVLELLKEYKIDTNSNSLIDRRRIMGCFGTEVVR